MLGKRKDRQLILRGRALPNFCCFDGIENDRHKNGMCVPSHSVPSALHFVTQFVYNWRSLTFQSLVLVRKS